MNVLFLSPAFPPNVYLFCTALRAHGATVLGVGDSPPSDVRPELSNALTEYLHVPRMHDYDALHRAVAGLIARHGRIERLDSNVEHWLGIEARLREDFNVPGLRPAVAAEQRSKSGMARIFAAAGLEHPPGEVVVSPDQVTRFARAHGFPLVFKPDTGAGAARTFTVADARALELALAGPLDDYVVQPFVAGDIVTFDGLTDRDGRVVYFTSHAYDTGIMQVLTGALDGHYYSLREVPAALEAVGRRAVAAFDLRERFFHAEFFHTPDGRYVALEMNLRPPGGFSTDLMNYASDIDVYDLWARAVTGSLPEVFTYQRKYHTAHAGRRASRRYRLGHDALVAQLGATLVLHRPIPREFAATMGDVMYLLRHEDLDALKRAIALVQEPASS